MKNVKSPKKFKHSVKSNPDSRTRIRIIDPTTGKRWSDMVSISFVTYLNKIKSLKKSDFE